MTAHVRIQSRLDAEKRIRGTRALLVNCEHVARSKADSQTVTAVSLRHFIGRTHAFPIMIWYSDPCRLRMRVSVDIFVCMTRA